MKRRSHGVNLDDGVALSTPEEFERLFVDARPEVTEELGVWLRDPDAAALIVAGQIGSGKTTLLSHMHRGMGDGIIRVEFDQVPIDESPGAFLAVLLGATIQTALKLEVAVDGVGLDTRDFSASGIADWAGLVNLLLLPPASLSQASAIRCVYELCGRECGAVRKAWTQLVQRIETRLGAPPPIVAEGVDKFLTNRADYTALADTLDFLSDQKVIFEANAIHLFEVGRDWASCDKVLIEPADNAALLAMYEKRLGAYAPMHADVFPLLLQHSAGNPRQALRLLNGYYYRRVQKQNGIDGALAMSMHRASQDLLQLGFSSFPADLLAILRRDGFAEAALFSDPKTREDARVVVYRNWAMLERLPDAGETRWPIRINPLVSDAIRWEAAEPEASELVAARKWAEDRSMSPMGLTVPQDEETGESDWEAAWSELSSSESSEDELNIVGLLEEIAASLFSDCRQDRIVISYRSDENLGIAVEFLAGKAASHGPFVLKKIEARGGDGQDPIALLQSTVGKGSTMDVYCVFLDDAWNEAQLDALDRMRDRFADCQMLWFVSHESLLKYLQQWPQLRQLMRFYVLEDDFLSALSSEEIKADIDVLEELGADRREGIGKMRHVLEYLHGQGGQA